MARVRLSAGVMAFAALLCAAPVAYAQFGSIFNDEPPRPPGNVPGNPREQMQPPADYNRQRDFESGVEVRRPQYRDARPDRPPAQPLPSPMSLPPSSRPGGGGIQSQDLAPPPGAPQGAPDSLTPVMPTSPAPPQNANVPPVQTLPGLPPGTRQPQGAPQQPGNTAPQPGDEIVVEPPPRRIANPTAVFSGLDKITGRIISFDVAINETVQFGALQVTPRVCYSRPPTETPNTDAFVQVDEVTLNGEIKRIFSGWMFAASPGLNAVEHPIYDVSVTDCKGGTAPEVAEAAPEPAAKPAPPARGRAPAQPRQGQPPAQPRAQQPPGLLPSLR